MDELDKKDKNEKVAKGLEWVTSTFIIFPSIRECRKHFAKLVPGIESTWKDQASRLLDDTRLPLDTKLEDFKCPWPNNFYGCNIKQFMEDHSYPVVKEDEWVYVDKEATVPRITLISDNNSKTLESSTLGNLFG